MRRKRRTESHGDARGVSAVEPSVKRKRNCLMRKIST